MQRPTALVRAWQSVQRNQQPNFTVLYGVAWTVVNIGVVVFILAIAGQ